jgi:hypothetical protein
MFDINLKNIWFTSAGAWPKVKAQRLCFQLTHNHALELQGGRNSKECALLPNMNKQNKFLMNRVVNNQ